MTEKTRWGLRVVMVSLTLGVLADLLLREGPWGLNFCLWILMGMGVTLFFASHRSAVAGQGFWCLLIPGVVFALGIAWRDSAALKVLDLLALFVVLSMTLHLAQGGSILRSSMTQYVSAGIITAIDGLFASLGLLFHDINWKEVSSNRRSQRSLAVARGAMISLPLLVLFGALLAGADVVFDGVVKDILHVNFFLLLTHFLLSAWFAWVAAGYLRGMLFGKDREEVAKIPVPSISLGIIETSIVLGVLDALFLLFVVIQVRYLFGGSRLVEISPGLTYAEYARRGFFELVSVSALMLPLLLGFHWALRMERRGVMWVFRVLAGVQILLLSIVMLSAVQRLRIYEQGYGLTQPRFYAAAFLVWLALLLLWFVLTVLRDKREGFAVGAMVAGLGLVFILHVVNPDAFIVRKNTERAAQRHHFDARYGLLLSADAIPELVSSFPSLPPEDQSFIAARLVHRWLDKDRQNWRTWSWGRSRAWSVLEKNEPWLRKTAEGAQHADGSWPDGISNIPRS